MTDEEKKEYFRDFILWQQKGLDIEKQHCLLINFGVNMNFEYPQISMTQQGEAILNPFTHTEQDSEKIRNFDFWKDEFFIRYLKERVKDSAVEREKVMIEETFCTLVAVGGKFLRKKAFKKVMKTIDEIRYDYLIEMDIKKIIKDKIYKSDFFL